MKKIILASLFSFIFNVLAFAQGDIRQVDFKNFTYPAGFCAGEDREEITVRGGEFSEEKEVDGYTERLYFEVFSVTYGDLNGDRRDEAIILTVCNTGGTGNFSEGLIYTLKNGKPALLTGFEGGDRAYGGLRSARVERGLLTVERNDVGELGGACCPEFVVTTNYKLNGNELIEEGKSLRRELYPATRVSFAKGKTYADVNVNIGAGELKRFTLGARTGQTMIVSGDSADISVTLSKGEANVTENERGFVAKLNETGDFVIQIQNFSDKATKAIVRIQIR
jgi:hypothetical protein